MERVTENTTDIINIISDMFGKLSSEQEHKLRYEIATRLNSMSLWGYEVASCS